MSSGITLSSVGDITNTVTAQTVLNNNFSAIQALWPDNLSRSGSSPNQMESTLDMNFNQIINLPPPNTSNSALDYKT